MITIQIPVAKRNTPSQRRSLEGPKLRPTGWRIAARRALKEAPLRRDVRFSGNPAGHRPKEQVGTELSTLWNGAPIGSSIANARAAATTERNADEHELTARAAKGATCPKNEKPGSQSVRPFYFETHQPGGDEPPQAATGARATSYRTARPARLLRGVRPKRMRDGGGMLRAA